MPRFAANLTMMFNEVEFLDRFEEASKAKFTAVEYLFPYDYRPEKLAGLLHQYGLVQALFDLPSGNWEEGERGIACDPSRVGEFQEGVEQAIEYAKVLSCNQVTCLAGIAPVGADPSTLRETFVSNLRYAASELSTVGVKLLIEPINTRDIPGFYLCHTAQARSILNEVGSDNLGLQYDVYHMQIMEGNLAPTMELNMDVINHVQIADNPGRNEPGTGEINYQFLLGFLDKIGYSGWVGCEYNPLVTTESGLAWIVPYQD